MITGGEARCVHDLADGGLAIAAAEMALASDVGITLNDPGVDAHAALFGEDQARYLIAAADPGPILAAAGAAGVACRLVGSAGGETFATQGLFAISLSRLRATHEGWMPRYMEGGAPAA
jgi:phosphoribosylformylglycinamidine synthase